MQLMLDWSNIYDNHLMETTLKETKQNYSLLSYYSSALFVGSLRFKQFKQ